MKLTMHDTMGDKIKVSALRNYHFILFYYLLILEERGRQGGEREGERERNMDLSHLFMHSPVDSYMCPDWGLNPQPWCIGRTL